MMESHIFQCTFVLFLSIKLTTCYSFHTNNLYNIFSQLSRRIQPFDPFSVCSRVSLLMSTKGISLHSIKCLNYNTVLKSSFFSYFKKLYPYSNLSFRNFTTNKKDFYHKQFSKLEKLLENVHLNTLLPLKDVVSLYSGDYDEGVYKLFKSELLTLYYDSYLQILKSSDSKFKGLKSRLVETQSSMFSGEFHKISECDKVILQVKAGVGGEESARFASELFNMYTTISKDRGFRMVKHTDNAAEITGGTEFFKYEFGVHRVQRVPFNSKRIQTSSAVVTVVPHFALESTRLKSSDLHVETMRSSGSGGQSVNKSETAVRVTHIPSGISVSIRDTSSQIDNKSIAMDMILKKLREKQEAELEMVKSEVKSTQFRTGDRSEKIRTFNFMHDTITDHRCKLTLNGVDSFLEFGEGIEEIHQRLMFIEDSLIVNFMMENIDMIVEYYGIANKLK